MDPSLGTALVVGFVLGLRHAMDADHVAAVSAFVSEHRSLVRACILGTFWGIGHTAALLIAGIATIAFKLTISPGLERALEMTVALVVILLGGHVLLRSIAGAHVHRHAHSHDGSAHSHFHWHLGEAAEHGHLHLWRVGRRPLLVGLLHGLAGSAALMLLVLATIPSPPVALLYILIFGLGSTAGMLVLSGLLGIPFAVAAQHSQRLQRVVQGLAGAGGLAVGLLMLRELGAG